jgi:hypothetical protein
MFPQLSEALLHDRVREMHQAADARRRARFARMGLPVAAAKASQPVATLRSLTTARRAHAPARHAGEHGSRRAA